MALLQRTSDNKFFIDNVFAFKTPFKLNLEKSKDTVKQNNKGIEQEEIKEK